MKNALDMITDVRGLLNVSSITSQINGGIWPGDRPAGSDKIDLVVNAITITNSQIQTGSGNVNIYAPLLIQTINGKQSKLPDYVKLSSLVKLVQDAIDERYEKTFRVEVDEGSGKIYEDTDGSYFANVKFYYQSYNKNYKNI
ncbi:hypothetical protein D9M68_875310 [compost metagenome]